MRNSSAMSDADQRNRRDLESPAQPRAQHGGRRPGAGRPKGSRDALPRGAVSAIKALRHRVPDGTPEPLARLADEALGTVAEVMRGRLRRGTERLNAARVVREEICGPVPKRHELTGRDGEPVNVVFTIREED